MKQLTKRIASVVQPSLGEAASTEKAASDEETVKILMEHLEWWMAFNWGRKAMAEKLLEIIKERG